MDLRSDAFQSGGAIPLKHTCDGENLSPPLAWKGVPDRARSFALICDDPDSPGGTFYHWAAYDIPIGRSDLAEGIGRQEPGFEQAINDFERRGYDGPCPPRAHGPHHYRFRLLALSVQQLPALGQRSCLEVEREAWRHLVAVAELVGLYKRR